MNNKRVDEFIAKYALTERVKQHVGEINGYYSQVKISSVDSVPFRAKLYAFNVDTERVYAFLAENKKRFGLVYFQATSNIISFGLNALTLSSGVKKLDELLIEVTNLLKMTDALGAEHCSHCGKLFDDDKVTIENIDFIYPVHSDCKTEIENEKSLLKAEFDLRPNNYLKGILGALLGACAGGVILFVLYLLDFVAAVSGLVAVVAASVLYNKFGGKPTMMKIVIVTISSLAVLYLFHTFALLAEFQMMIGEEGLTGMVTAGELYGLFIAEYPAEYIGELVTIMIFAIIGIVAAVIDIVKEVKLAKRV